MTAPHDSQLVPTAWPESWGPAAELTAMLPGEFRADDVSFAGELLALHGYDPDPLLLAQAATITGRTLLDTASNLIEISGAS